MPTLFHSKIAIQSPIFTSLSNMICRHGFPFSFTLILLFVMFEASSTETPITGATQVNGSTPSNEMMPLMEPVKVVEMRLMLNESRRGLNGFQICNLCTCCGGAKGVCLSSPCCYGINCNIPGRPFGFCSFTPKKCNCFGC